MPLTAFSTLANSRVESWDDPLLNEVEGNRTELGALFEKQGLGDASKDVREWAESLTMQPASDSSLSFLVRVVRKLAATGEELQQAFEASSGNGSILALFMHVQFQRLREEEKAKRKEAKRKAIQGNGGEAAKGS